jgi:hypothetical protein
MEVRHDGVHGDDGAKACAVGVRAFFGVDK